MALYFFILGGIYMEIAVIEKIKRLPAQTEESLRDVFSILTKHKKASAKRQRL
jgi:hypothetical protein